MWYAGVDWADTHHVVVVVDETGQQVATKQVEHTVEGLAQLTSFLPVPLEHLAGARLMSQLQTPADYDAYIEERTATWEASRAAAPPPAPAPAP